MLNTEAMDTITSRLDRLDDEIEAGKALIARLDAMLSQKLEKEDLLPFARKEQLADFARDYAKKSELPPTSHLALRNELALTRVSEETVFLKTDRPLGEERMEEIARSVEKDRRNKGFKAGVLKSFEFIRAGAAHGEHRGPLYVVEYLGIG